MTLVEKVSKMSDDAFERWMKRNGYTGLAAAKLAAARKAALERGQTWSHSPQQA